MCEARRQRSGRERSDEMVRLNAKGSARRWWCIGVVAALVLMGWGAGARAQSVAASDLTGGYVVLPKILVHTTGGDPAVLPGEQAFDTEIQLSNTNEAAPITVDCWWVDANSHCGSRCNPLISTCAICETNADCTPGLPCVPDWSVADFQITLTNGQPIGFTAASGLKPVPCDPSFSGTGCQGAAGGFIRGVQEDPFRGELKCLQVDANDLPVDRSDLKIEATIVSTTIPPATSPATTAASYNGIGFRTQSLGTLDPADPLCLGPLPTGNPDTCAATYAPCPGVLILDHFFEGAPTEFGIASTDLTLVPCSEDLGDPTVQGSFDVVAQMLVYNEFEERFSTSAHVECFRETSLADIDTVAGPTGDQFSIFSVGLEGTLTGQTRIRGVQGSNGRLGYGLLGVAIESYSESSGSPAFATTAFNLHESGFRADPTSTIPTGGDAVYRTVFPPP